MVITILQARVEPEKAAILQGEYNKAVGELDEGITQTFLLRDARDPDVWQIMTFWESREALDKMRNSGQTPRGVLMFHTAGATPTLSILTVENHAAAPA